jgi:hypothetical protein
MKRFLLILCLAAATFGSLMAGPVDQQKAAKIGAKFLSTTAIAQKNADIQLQLVSTVANRDAVDYYVFNVANGEGFVVVAADDRVKPILAYSTSGYFNPNDVADGFEFTLSSFQQEIQYVRNHNIEATPDIIAEWKSVGESGQITPGRNARAVTEPMCKTLWNQNYPWNSQCPSDTAGPGGHVYSGCVSAAMGQIMKYWEWPAQGTGSHSYTPEGYEEQTANFGETEYHFERMPLTIDSTSTDDQVFDIAQLLHHIGVAVEMIYSGNGSAANSFGVPVAFTDYFRYSCDTLIINLYGLIPGMGYTNEEWIQMLKDGGLDEGLPLFYTGSDVNGAGAHAFVCDGYDENDYFHFNWGWSGKDNAWCTIGALNTTTYAFNRGNAFVGHIRPQEEAFLRPEKVANFQAAENNSFNGVHLTWNNPTTDLNGNALTGAITVTIMRNFEEIAVLTNAQPGASMEYDDNSLAPGLYEYEIFVSNEAGISRTAYASLLVGEKCDLGFQLRDAGGDGWKGASISVTDQNGQRIAIITMKEGAEQTLTLPLLKGNLNFIWNSGWYHDKEQYDTDGECSFTILDSQGEELFNSSVLSPGIFFTYQNNCDYAVEEDLASKPLVYPNPTKGLLHVESEGKMRVSVSNSLGQTIMETTVEGNATLDLSRFGSGMYFVRFETENGVTSQKINLIGR